MFTINELIMTYTMYAFYFMVLLFLPTGKSRLLYLHGVSIIIILFANYEMKFYILLSMFHSAIHNLWPFLKDNGYDNREISVFDVACHTIMIALCYQKIISVIDDWQLFHILTMIFFLGSVINCATSYSIIGTTNPIVHSIFEYTTIFQAISTGYWVATMLWYDHYTNPKFFSHWVMWILLMTINWFIYKFYPRLVGLSMQYKYVEAVFIVCTWNSGLRSW
ncbi:hypothetical protein QLL95_gp0215 [Cotonvirus japonicus]|uniref:TLC domain-containing protein n=1 Tax=Cotonvirus japonicus TaxID=2811091 RepID=A0ABM7NRD6_9VIRU|nr:hypothetical protein QLL95_gp0215 [Cotonvirus japonicus]BCS82704.1 hypothetical protein [Cotonvirus japonicus]